MRDLKKKKSSVTVAEFGTAGVANVVLTRQQRSGDCVGDLFAVCKIRCVFDWLRVCVSVVGKILVHRFRLLCGGELIFSFKLHLSSVANKIQLLPHILVFFFFC